MASGRNPPLDDENLVQPNDVSGLLPPIGKKPTGPSPLTGGAPNASIGIEKPYMGASSQPEGSESNYWRTYAPGTESAKGSKFVNFDRVLNANAGTAEQMSRNAGIRLADQAKQAQAKGQSALGGFNSAVAGGSRLTGVAPGSAMTGRVSQDGGAGLTGLASTNAYAQTQKPYNNGVDMNMSGAYVEQRAAPGTSQAHGTVAPGYGALRDMEYTGPTDIGQDAGWQEAVGLASRTTDELAALNSPGGFAGLAKATAGGGADYSQGMNSLDAALLGHTSGDRFSRLNEKYKGLNDVLAKGGQEANARAAKAQGDVTAWNAANEEKRKNAAPTEPEAPKKDEYELALEAETAANPDLLKEKGGWGQVDFGGFGSPTFNSTTDAGKFDYVMRRSGLIQGMDEATTKALYEKLSPAEMRELFWLLGGPSAKAGGFLGTGGPGYAHYGFSQPHPYFAKNPSSAAPGSKEEIEYAKAAFADYVARMRKKHGV